MFGLFGAIWGIGGICLLLAFTITRLLPITVEAFDYSWHWNHWASLIFNTLVMAYYEGYKGFQKGFSPRLAARARYLRSNPKRLHVLLAPLFCAGYFYSTKRRQLSIILLTLFIIIAVVLVGELRQPWRGIVDAGVVLGLAWGLVSTTFFGFTALSASEFNHATDIPDDYCEDIPLQKNG